MSVNLRLEATRLLSRLNVHDVNARRQPWYTTHDLALLWRVDPITVRWRLWRMRQAGLGPTTNQLVLHKLNAARRFNKLRDDYVQLMERHFIYRVKFPPA